MKVGYDTNAMRIKLLAFYSCGDEPLSRLGQEAHHPKQLVNTTQVLKSRALYLPFLICSCSPIALFDRVGGRSIACTSSPLHKLAGGV